MPTAQLMRGRSIIVVLEPVANHQILRRQASVRKTYHVRQHRTHRGPERPVVERAQEQRPVGDRQVARGLHRINALFQRNPRVRQVLEE